MKNWLFLAMFVALGFVACDDDDEGVDPYAAYHGFHVKDTVGLKVGWDLWGVHGHSHGASLDTSWVSECVPTHLFRNTLEEIGKVYMVGLRNGKLWFGRFDLDTREQLHEWTSKEEFPLHRRVDVEYGEVIEFDANIGEIISVVRQDDEHVLFSLNLSYLRNYVSGGAAVLGWYCAHGNEITVCEDNVFYYSYRINTLYPMRFACEWWDGYMSLDDGRIPGATSVYGQRFYSRNGEMLFDREKGYGTIDNMYPLSMEEAVIGSNVSGAGMSKEWTFRRENLKTGTVAWESEIVLELKEEDARVNACFSSLDLWVYTVEVTYRSGEKEKHDYRLNVETGAWTEL